MDIKFSTEKTSDKYLTVNSCDVEYLGDKNYNRIRPNGRVDYHILYIAEGYCYITDDNQEKRIDAGNVILYKPYEPQKYSFYAEDNSVSCYIHFTGVGCEEILNSLNLSNQRIFYINKGSTFKTIFEKMLSEFNLKRPFYEFYCSGYLMELLSYIARKNEYINQNKELKTEKRIEAVCLNMHMQYRNNCSMKYYATLCCLSTSRFVHLFTKCMGISPSKYLNNIRIEKAKELLINTDSSISEASRFVGYADQNYFSRIFKKYTGHPPSFYKNK